MFPWYFQGDCYEREWKELQGLTALTGKNFFLIPSCSSLRITHVHRLDFCLCTICQSFHHIKHSTQAMKKQGFLGRGLHWTPCDPTKLNFPLIGTLPMFSVTQLELRCLPRSSGDGKWSPRGISPGENPSASPVRCASSHPEHAHETTEPFRVEKTLKASSPATAKPPIKPHPQIHIPTYSAWGGGTIRTCICPIHPL